MESNVRRENIEGPDAADKCSNEEDAEDQEANVGYLATQNLGVLQKSDEAVDDQLGKGRLVDESFHKAQLFLVVRHVAEAQADAAARNHAETDGRLVVFFGQVLERMFVSPAHLSQGQIDEVHEQKRHVRMLYNVGEDGIAWRNEADEGQDGNDEWKRDDPGLDATLRSRNAFHQVVDVRHVQNGEEQGAAGSKDGHTRSPRTQRYWTMDKTF